MSSVKKRTDRSGKVAWRAYYRDPSGGSATSHLRAVSTLSGT
jgi:hypothetical protein